MRKGFALSMVVALALGSAGISQADMFKPSKAQQVELGKRAAADLKKKEKSKILADSDRRVQVLRRVAGRLLATVDDSKEPWEYTFDVIDSKEINAFALPGGATFFYTGLLAKLKTEDELAGILAHELTHTRREHWATAYADSQKRQLGLFALLMLLRANRTVSGIADISNQLLFDLPYSRRHEIEADEDGFDMMVKAGYNPQGIVDVFKMLGEQGGSKPPEFLSTHPAEKNRVARMQARIKPDAQYPAMRPLEF